MGSGAQSTPVPRHADSERQATPRGGTVAFQQLQNVHTRESFCVETFDDDFSKEEQAALDNATPRYSSSSNFSDNSGSSPSKGPDGRVAYDECTNITPVASSDFDQLGKSPRDVDTPRPLQKFRKDSPTVGNRISGESDGNDSTDWDFDADRDMPERKGHVNVIESKSDVDKTMLNSTLTFAQRNVEQLSLEPWHLSNAERNYIRNFVAQGFWPGNKFGIGMTVTVLPKSEATNQTQPGRLAVITQAHCGSYDVTYVDGNTLNRSSTTTKTTPESKHAPIESKSSSFSLESKTSTLSWESSISYSEDGPAAETNVDQSRIVEPDDFSKANNRRRAQSVDVAEHFLKTASYPLLDPNAITACKKAREVDRAQDTPDPELLQEPQASRRKSSPLNT